MIKIVHAGSTKESNEVLRSVWASRKCAHGDSGPTWKEQLGAGQNRSEGREILEQLEYKLYQRLPFQEPCPIASASFLHCWMQQRVHNAVM